MIINPIIRAAFQEISERAVEHSNTVSEDYRYMRRMLKVYDTHFTEEERIFLFMMLMEFVHYRSVMVDPDNLLVLSNIKLRTYMFIFILSLTAMVIAAGLFKTNSTLNGLIEVITHFTALFSL